MKNSIKLFVVNLLFIFAFYFLLSCEMKPLKTLAPPIGPPVDIKDNNNPGTQATFKQNLAASYGSLMKASTLDQAYTYNPAVSVPTPVWAITIVDGLTPKGNFIFESEVDRARGVFRLVYDETLPDTYGIMGVAIKGDGKSIYVTESVAVGSSISTTQWNNMFLFDSSQYTTEEMWLKNFQENRPPSLYLENYGRILTDNRYLIPIILTYKKALSASRAIYTLHGTIYMVGTEFQNAGREFYVSYTEEQITRLLLAKNEADIDWTKMNFADYTVRYNSLAP